MNKLAGSGCFLRPIMPLNQLLVEAVDIELDTDATLLATLVFVIVRLNSLGCGGGGGFGKIVDKLGGGARFAAL